MEGLNKQHFPKHISTKALGTKKTGNKSNVDHHQGKRFSLSEQTNRARDHSKVGDPEEDMAKLLRLFENQKN